MQLALGWVLTTGTLGALGCIIAGGHPLSVLTAFVASPLTPLHPALSSGMVSAAVEAWMRKPTYRDFQIGRASCRERVCQYVSISGVAVSLKKKKNNKKH